MAWVALGGHHLLPLACGLFRGFDGTDPLGGIIHVCAADNPAFTSGPYKVTAAAWCAENGLMNFLTPAPCWPWFWPGG